MEAVIGALLLLSSLPGLRHFHDFYTPDSYFIRLLHVLFLTGLVIPTLTGAYHGNDPTLIVRDVLAFLFLCLPLFVLRPFYSSDLATRFLPLVLVFAGTAFAIRTLIPAFNIWVAGDELLYLSNSPLVLFAALFLTMLFWRILTHCSAGKIPALIMTGGMIGVIVAAMLLDVQRATVAAIAITLIVLWVVTLIRTPRQIWLPTILLAGMAFVLAPWLGDTAAAFYKKTSEVGLNMRLQEIEAVFGALGANPAGFFIGTGWGGAFSSPAVGGLDVNYTHSLLSTMFLKGGVLLLALVAGLCLAALHQIFLIFQRDSGCGLAVFWPFVIPVLLYASHKSLDFGLLLLLIGVWSNRRR